MMHMIGTPHGLVSDQSITYSEHMSPDTTPRPSLAIRLALAHPWRVVATWIAIVVASVAIIALFLGDGLNNSQETTNRPESMRALEEVRAHVAERQGVDEVLIIRSERHLVDSPEFAAFLAPLIERAPEVGVEIATPEGASSDESASPFSEDRRAMLVPLSYTKDPADSAERLIEAVQDADRAPDFTVDVTGNYTLDHDFTKLSERDLKEGELYVGLPVAMLVLLLVFGTVVGALMPLMIAVVAIICALALTALIGQAWEVNLFVVNMISGMGSRSASTTRCSCSRAIARSAPPAPGATPRSAPPARPRTARCSSAA